MKKLILSILFIFCLSFQANALGPMMLLSGGGAVNSFSCLPAYDICQNLENAAGYDNSETWNETVGDGTIDEDYAASPITGTYSLRMIDGGADSSVITDPFSAHADYSTTYWYFRFKVLVDIDADEIIFQILDDTAAIGASIYLDADGDLKLYHGSVGDRDLGSPIDVSGGGVFHVWGDWVTETGTDLDGVAHLYVCADTSCGGVKPGSPEVTVTVGSANYPGIDRIKFFAAGGSLDWVIDRIIVSNSEIGDQDHVD